MNECTYCQTELEEGLEICRECSGDSEQVAPETMPEDEATPENGRQAYLSLEDGSRLEIAEGETLLGRLDPSESVHPDLDLSVYGGHELGVSRRHAIIENLDNEYRLEDLGTTNGTIVNTEKVEPGAKVTLAEGDTIYLGRWKAVFHISP